MGSRDVNHKATENTKKPNSKNLSGLCAFVVNLRNAEPSLF